MDIPVKKLKSGFSLPVYGLGLWQMGGREAADTSKDSQEIAAIQKAIELGVTHLDTAESYGAGHTEELLGQAIKGYPRERLIVVTKVSGDNQGYDGVKRAINASLKRLSMDYVDLYLLHRFPYPGLSIAETMKAMNELMEQGIVKNIGVSNFTNNRFKEAQKYTKHPLVCNQVHYNVEYREVEDKGILKFCQENDSFLVAYRPLQKGKLPNSKLLKEMSEKYNKTPTQIAINWLITQDNVVTIAKTSNIEHLKENLGAVGWKLEPDDIERIRREYEVQHKVSDVIPLNYESDIAP